MRNGVYGTLVLCGRTVISYQLSVISNQWRVAREEGCALSVREFNLSLMTIINYSMFLPATDHRSLVTAIPRS